MGFGFCLWRGLAEAEARKPDRSPIDVARWATRALRASGMSDPLRWFEVGWGEASSVSF